MAVETLYSTQIPNNTREVSGNVTVYRDDVSLLCDTSLAPVNIYLLQIPADKWNTEYIVYVKDLVGNAATNNITIIAPTGFLINGLPQFVMNVNGQSVEVTISSDTDYLVVSSSQNNTPGITKIVVDNTVFVMKNGNDSTGVVQRFDLPFLTIAAARAALLAFFTGPTAPAANNRIQIIVYSGYYLEPIILDNFVDYYLNDCVIENQSSNNATIDDAGVAVNSIIYGQATINRTGTGASPYCILTSNASTALTVYANNIISSIGDSVRCFAGLQNIFSNVDCSGGISVNCLGGSQSVTGNISGSFASTFGSINLIQCSGSGSVQNINGNITANATTLSFVACQSGTQNIYCTELNSNGGNTLIIRSVTGNQNVNIINATGSVQFSCFGGSQSLTLQNGISINLNDSICEVSGGTQYIYGNLNNQYAGGTVAFGMCLSCTGGVQIFKGDATASSTAVEVSAVSGGTQKLRFGTITGNATSVAPVYKSGGTLILEAVTIVSNSFANSITSVTQQNVLVYGGCQANVPVDSNTTQQVSSVLVDANVQ